MKLLVTTILIALITKSTLSEVAKKYSTAQKDEELSGTKKYETDDYETYKGAPVPENTRPAKFSLPDDKCGDSSVRFKDDGYCYPVLKTGPCSNPYFWITVDPYTMKGVCTPRLCGRDKVFVGTTGKCHDINDSNVCQGGRRLYYSAYGDPICDCPIGQYPFPKEGDDCVAIFTQGPCPDDHVVTPTSSGSLECKPNYCPASPKSLKNFILQFVLVKNGSDYSDEECYALGTSGPCCSPSALLGYNIFKLKAECVDLYDPSSPYFSSSEENDLLDELYDVNGKEYDDDYSRESKSFSRIRRQGIIQLPSIVPNTLLNPCQQGGRNANNLKCANILIPGLPQNGSRPTTSVYRCQANDFLQADGQCAPNRSAASCGPSYQFVAALNQCRRRINS